MINKTFLSEWKKMNVFLDTKLVISSPYVDENVMDEFKNFMGDDGDDLAKELIELYLKNTPLMITKIKEDINAWNIASLKTHVHGLKGSSAQLGITGIASLCRKIEDVIFEERYSEINQLFTQLEEVYQQVELYYRSK
ncbi:MAG: Hpt domain-containing protein [Anaerolineaceae bacterium]